MKSLEFTATRYGCSGPGAFLEVYFGKVILVVLGELLVNSVTHTTIVAVETSSAQKTSLDIIKYAHRNTTYTLAFRRRPPLVAHQRPRVPQCNHVKDAVRDSVSPQVTSSNTHP